MKIAAFILFAAALCQAAESAVDIIRRSVNQDTRNWDRAKDYTFREKIVRREMDSAGRPTKTESQTRDVLIMYGRPVSREIEKNGKPLTGSERAKEEARFEKVVEKRRKETSDENTKERRRYEQRREEQRRFMREIPEAFDFKLLPEETLDGRPLFVIEATPKAGYRPRDSQAKFLPKIRGKLWVDKTEYNWVKAEAETIDTISIGLFLARVGRGTMLHFEQRRVNGELWLPAKALLKLDARLAVFKRLRGEQEVEFSDYRKFQTDSKITIADEPKAH
jgi:hypothetical protein